MGLTYNTTFQTSIRLAEIFSGSQDIPPASPEPTFEPRDQTYLTALCWNINPEYAAGAGMFSLDGFDPAREREVTHHFFHVLQNAGADTRLVSVKDVLAHEPWMSLVDKILDLTRMIGPRNAFNKPRLLLLSGFMTCGLFSPESCDTFISKCLDRTNRKVMNTRFEGYAKDSVDELEQAMKHCSEEERALFPIWLFPRIFVGRSWQNLACRKNTAQKTENIAVITVAPRAVFRSIWTYETGTTTPLGAQSDALFRFREYLCNWVNDGVGGYPPYSPEYKSRG